MDKEYGYCEVCGIEIGLRRLEARPTATLCIDCNQRKKKAMANPEFMKRMKPDGTMNWIKHQFENDSILSLFGISPISRRKFCDSDW